MSRDKIRKIYSLLIIIVLIVTIAIFGYKYFNDYKDFLSNTDVVKEIILSYGSYSFLVFIIIQILQIIIFFIPGEVVQLAAGFIFGPWVGFLLSIIGILVGSAFTFQISKLLGKPFVERICHKKNTWIISKLEKTTKGLEKIIFIFYLIPGIPKDLLGYICGITNINLKKFLIISTIGRTPALMFSCFFGDKISFENLPTLLLLGAIFLVVFLIAFVISRKYIGKIKHSH